MTDLRNQIDINQNASLTTKVALTKIEAKHKEYVLKTKNQL